MGMTYTDVDGSVKTPIMGCYGIGVGRLAASVMEAKHDDYGPIWPITIAPWQVHLCCMRPDNEDCKTAADNIYNGSGRRNVRRCRLTRCTCKSNRRS